MCAALGKGRKSRCTPLRPDVVAALKAWLLTTPRGTPLTRCFRARAVGALSADACAAAGGTTRGDGVSDLSDAQGQEASRRIRCGTRAAMALLRRGVDLTVIALWLGHESTETTEVYLHADMRIKERALAHATPSGVSRNGIGRPIRCSPSSRDSDYAARPSDTHSLSLRQTTAPWANAA